MHRHPLRRALVWGAAATLLLPIVLAIVLGLGGLLGGLGDGAGSRACLRVGLVVGVVWLTAIVATTAGSAIAHLDRPQEPAPRRCDRRGRRPRRRRWGDADPRHGAGGEIAGNGPGDADRPRP